MFHKNIWGYIGFSNYVSYIVYQRVPSNLLCHSYLYPFCCCWLLLHNSTNMLKTWHFNMLDKVCVVIQGFYIGCACHLTNFWPTYDWVIPVSIRSRFTIISWSNCLCPSSRSISLSLKQLCIVNSRSPTRLSILYTVHHRIHSASADIIPRSISVLFLLSQRNSRASFTNGRFIEVLQYTFYLCCIFIAGGSKYCWL